MFRTLLTACLFAIFAASCGPDTEALIGEEGVDTNEDFDALTTAVTNDDLNGQWKATVAGQALTEDAVIESWTEVGVRLKVAGATYALTRTGDALAGAQVTLAVHANKGGAADDSIDGTVAGAPVVFKRDTDAKPPITISFPGDRPFRSLLTEVLAPLAQQDRESYTVLHSTEAGAWLRSCELYRHGSWQRKFMKGTTWAEQSASFNNIVFAMNNVKTTPRRITKEYKFQTALKANLADQTQMGLAMSTFGMYFSAAGGRSLRLPITPDSTAFFITDRPARAEKIGVVAMATPTHGPLASTFGRQLLDLGAMPVADSAAYARAMMDLLVSSDVSRARALSGVGRSALTDWYAVMAIEDYRGVAFGYPTLGWGYNMTNVQFYGLIVRALARPGAVDSAGKPVLGQVSVGGELRPGDPSYADVLNHGNDMLEYGDMSRLKTLTTSYLRERHPELITAVESAFSGIVPSYELDSRARVDVFHFICAQLYDSRGRTAVLKNQAQAQRAVTAVVALFDTLNAESAQLETYLLAHGLVKSNVAAPISTGF